LASAITRLRNKPKPEGHTSMNKDNDDKDNAIDDVDDFENKEEQLHKQRIKSAAHFQLAKICEAQAAKFNKTISRGAIASLNNVLVDLAELMAKDLEMFARHAKRTTVRSDDVLLVARKVPSVLNHLKSINDEVVEQKQKKRKKKLPLVRKTLKKREKRTKMKSKTDNGEWSIQGDSNIYQITN